MIVAWIRLILKSLGKVLTIFKVNEWLKNKWGKRKHKTMGLKQISGNTQIIFTVKTFFALIGTMLGLFYGFYQLVVVPKVNATEAHYKEMFDAQKDQNAATSQELIKINTSIGTLSGILQVIVQDKANGQPVANTGGSFGGGTVAIPDKNTTINGNH
jgi:cell division protein FtsB